MLAAERHRTILEELEGRKSVKVSELSDKFQVTEKTIREDLEKLEEKGLLKRTHGGAVPLPDEESLLPQIPNIKHVREKSAIAEYALTFIEPHDIIALDAGSTTLEIARKVKNMPLTVLTNDLLIIRELTAKDQIRLVVPGGYRHHNLLVGTDPDWVKKLNVHKLFLSATGIHPDYGLTIFTEELTRLKRVYMECAKTIYCVVDHKKFGKGALITFAGLDEIDYLITDSGIGSETLSKYGEAVNILQAPL
ncbi:DeoR family transcriptional regulator [Paenibacillus chitinolyticus]|uniref:DeoR/GlpR family DNA-binding transcription regulator n=1 Tax=Paenibacillus chitinolyticus TaxID=79263 RepID=UPI0026E4C2AC|nr:DeoR/GlpR family DNA-binding transcription regulator [Paenibacillus chitinolyticus]GKS09475.1 DeoR family transcriptional regulator [Paenibacillus chitinolyticus]